VADLGHVAEASGTGVDIDTARLVPGPDLLAAVAALGPASYPGQGAGAAAGGAPGGAALAPPMSWLLTGGEDHALAATFPPDARLPARWTVLGHVHAGHGVTVDGRPWPGRAGWEHYR